jgi:hypothetical protein
MFSLCREPIGPQRFAVLHNVKQPAARAAGCDHAAGQGGWLSRKLVVYQRDGDAGLSAAAGLRDVIGRVIPIWRDLVRRVDLFELRHRVP